MRIQHLFVHNKAGRSPTVATLSSEWPLSSTLPQMHQRLFFSDNNGGGDGEGKVGSSGVNNGKGTTRKPNIDEMLDKMKNRAARSAPAVPRPPTGNAFSSAAGLRQQEKRSPATATTAAPATASDAMKPTEDETKTDEEASKTLHQQQLAAENMNAALRGQRQVATPGQNISGRPRPAAFAREFADDDDDDADGPRSGVVGDNQSELLQQQEQRPPPSLEELTSLAAQCSALDDSVFPLFEPAAQPQLPGTSSTSTGTSPDPFSRAALESPHHHVPGTPLLPPGMARYRIDVQYQGSDFDGWMKSTEKMRMRRGSTGSTSSTSSSRGVTLDDDAARPRARHVLQDALAVALDLDHVTVVASVVPETGVHVHRLVCHADLPASIEMQPRVVMQRATLWLQHARVPLAILAFYPCSSITPVVTSTASTTTRKPHDRSKRPLVTLPFDARHAALRRVYVYRILNRIAPPLFDSGLQWHCDQYLDVDRMNRFAATILQGTHDFGAFVDPQLGHALRRSLEYSSSSSNNNRGAATDAAYMRFFADSGGGGVGGPRVRSSRRAEHRRTEWGYVGEDLLAEQAGTSSAAGILHHQHLERNNGRGIDDYQHVTVKPEYKEWSPYDEQDTRKIRAAERAREAAVFDYSPATTRTLDLCRVVRQEDEVQIWFAARSFLRHQIRNMVSLLRAVGMGLWDEREFGEFMAKGFSPRRAELRNRFPIAPVQGLTLWDIEYVSEAAEEEEDEAPDVEQARRLMSMMNARSSRSSRENGGRRGPPQQQAQRHADNNDISNKMDPVLVEDVSDPAANGGVRYMTSGRTHESI